MGTDASILSPGAKTSSLWNHLRIILFVVFGLGTAIMPVPKGWYELEKRIAKEEGKFDGELYEKWTMMKPQFDLHVFTALAGFVTFILLELLLLSSELYTAIATDGVITMALSGDLCSGMWVALAMTRLLVLLMAFYCLEKFSKMDEKVKTRFTKRMAAGSDNMRVRRCILRLPILREYIDECLFLPFLSCR
jgi:hypothetical protein